MRILEWIEAKNTIPKTPEWVCRNKKCRVTLDYTPGCKPMLAVFGPSTGMYSVDIKCLSSLARWLKEQGL